MPIILFLSLISVHLAFACVIKETKKPYQTMLLQPDPTILPSTDGSKTNSNQKYEKMMDDNYLLTQPNIINDRSNLSVYSHNDEVERSIIDVLFLFFLFFLCLCAVFHNIICLLQINLCANLR